MHVTIAFGVHAGARRVRTISFPPDSAVQLGNLNNKEWRIDGGNCESRLAVWPGSTERTHVKRTRYEMVKVAGLAGARS